MRALMSSVACPVALAAAVMVPIVVFFVRYRQVIMRLWLNAEIVAPLDVSAA
jgi:hypothetical protein